MKPESPKEKSEEKKPKTEGQIRDEAISSIIRYLDDKKDKRYKPTEEEIENNVRRPIPFEDGPWNKEGTIKVMNNGKGVYFSLQEGNYKTHGHNGCYVIEAIQFFRCIYANYKDKGGDRETAMIYTDLKNATLHDVERTARLIQENTWGEEKK